MSIAQVVQPPFYDAPIVDYPSGQQHSQAWTEYHQSVADRLAANAAAIAAKPGVTDGSDAPAGQVGEYLTASGGSVGLTSNTVANVATLSLTPGDWDVEGHVVFDTTAGTAYVVAGVSTVSAAFGSVATRVGGYATATQFRIGTGGAVRINVTAATTAYLVAQSGFTGGVNASGSIWARRAR